jgi:hypothetical protein
MAIYDFFLSRNGAASTPENYVGHEGRLFYDSATGEIRISDGVTPGGIPIPVTVATDATAGSVRPGQAFNMDGEFLRLNTGDSLDVFNNALRLLPATETTIGGIKAGPGVVIAADGTLSISSEGLSFTFGNFFASVIAGEDSVESALLSSINANEPIILASNGTGSVEIVGEFHVHAPTEDGLVRSALDVEPIFSVLSDGQVRMLVPDADQVQGAFEIVGNDAGDFFPPNQTGVILHTTGNQGSVNRVYHDANDNYPIIVGRRYNGTIASPTQVLDGEVFFRLAGQASTGTDFETFGPCKISWVATEDQGPTNQGGKIVVDVTANGTTAFGNAITVAEFTSDGLVVNNLLPASVDSSIGSAEDPFNDLFMTASTVYLGDLSLSNIDDYFELSGGGVKIYSGENVVFTIDKDTQLITSSAPTVITEDTDATSTITGSLRTAGGAGIVKDLWVGGSIHGSMSEVLSAGSYITATGAYDGGTARTFAVDATTAATASKVVARDSNAGIAAATVTFATREAGSFGAGQTITVDFATDRFVHCTVTAEVVTVAYTNITPGKEITIYFTLAGADREVNFGVPATNTTNGKAQENINGNATSQITATSFGTTVNDIYVHFKK